MYLGAVSVALLADQIDSVVPLGAVVDVVLQFLEVVVFGVQTDEGEVVLQEVGDVGVLRRVLPVANNLIFSAHCLVLLLYLFGLGFQVDLFHLDASDLSL